MIERAPQLGGECLYQGTIPSKTFREAAVYLSGIRQREYYGAAYRVKDRISIEDLVTRGTKVRNQQAEVVRDQLLRNHVDVLTGTASFIQPNILSLVTGSDSRLIEADKIVIATGSKPARPPEVEFDDEHVVDSDGLRHFREIPRSITVVGSGIIGLEFATIFHVLGVKVTLVDGRQTPLNYLDDEVAEAALYHIRSEGITVRYGETVSAVEVANKKAKITTVSGKQIVSDGVLYAAGRIGTTSTLNLEAIGLEPDKRGRLKVDEFYRTAVENVYAVGDVIGAPALASTSMEQGRRAAHHAFGAPTGKVFGALPYGIYAIPEMAMIGATEQKLTEQAVPYEIGVARFRELARAQIMGVSVGMLKIVFHRESLKLLGVHILGEQSTELIHTGQAVMALDGTIEYLRDAVFNYLTLAEAYKTAALDGFNRLSS